MARAIPDPPELRVTATRSDGHTSVAVAGELDMATVGDFTAVVREHLGRGPVLVELRELTFMDSSGVRALDALLGDCEREGWTLAISSDMHRNVERVLELTGMLATLPLEDPPPSAGAS